MSILLLEMDWSSVFLGSTIAELSELGKTASVLGGRAHGHHDSAASSTWASEFRAAMLPRRAACMLRFDARGELIRLRLWSSGADLGRRFCCS